MRMKRVGDGQGSLLVRGIFWLLRRKGGGLVAPLRVYAWRPDIMRTFLTLGRAVRKPGALPERLKRLAMYRTARLVECAFWIDLTDRLARAAGITAEELVDLTDYQESGLFSALEKDVLAYTDAMTATPVRVADDLFERLAGELSPEQMVELTAAIALENFSARFNRAFAIEPGES